MEFPTCRARGSESYGFVRESAVFFVACRTIHQAPSHIVLAQHALFGVLVLWMVHCEQGKCLSYLGFLICTQSILLRELGGALDGCTALRGGGATLRRLRTISSWASSASEGTIPWRCFRVAAGIVLRFNDATRCRTGHPA
jgi:hypothetical protein